MEYLEEEPEEATMGEVLIIAEIATPDSDRLVYRCTDDRDWVQRGLLHAALDMCDD